MGDHVMMVPGLIVKQSSRSFANAVAAATACLAETGVPLLATIDHAAAAAAAGLDLRPTTLLIFGAARGGTPLMVALPTSAIDLPLKLLVWQDHGDRVWLGADDPQWIAKRHHGGMSLDDVTAPLTSLIDKVLAAAA